MQNVTHGDDVLYEKIQFSDPAASGVMVTSLQQAVILSEWCVCTCVCVCVCAMCGCAHVCACGCVHVWCVVCACVGVCCMHLSCCDRNNHCQLLTTPSAYFQRSNPVHRLSSEEAESYVSVRAPPTSDSPVTSFHCHALNPVPYTVCSPWLPLSPPSMCLEIQGVGQ